MDFVLENRFSVLCTENRIQKIQGVWNRDYQLIRWLKDAQNVLEKTCYPGSKVIARIVT